MDVSGRPFEETRASDVTSLRAELRLELAQLETSLTKWMAIFVMGGVSVSIAITMAFTLGGAAWPGIGLFLLGTVVQLYVVWRFPSPPRGGRGPVRL
jgi:hypothetical protein